MFKQYKEDIQSFIDHDPATDNPLEIILLYPGFKALRSHKKAYWFYNHNMPFIARAISQRSAHKTGIEIHPGAKIGRRVVIDHGHGIVIGETAEVGDDVMIYQGVTLGGTGKDKGNKRHPTIKHDCIISAGAKILGCITVGENCKIGAGSVVLRDVPPDSTVVGIPGRVIKRNGKKVHDLEQDKRDPVLDEINSLKQRLAKLEKEVNKDEIL